MAPPFCENKSESFWQLEIFFVLVVAEWVDDQIFHYFMLC